MVLLLLEVALLAVAVAAVSVPRPAGNSSHSPSVNACPGASKDCNCAWTKSGSLCPKAKDDGSECLCRCCCPHKPAGFKCKWHNPHPGPPSPPPSPGPPAPPSPPPPPGPPPPPAPPGPGLTAVHIKGNHLVDADGNLVVLRGRSPFSYQDHHISCSSSGDRPFCLYQDHHMLLLAPTGVSHSGSEYTCLGHGDGIFEGEIDATFVAGLELGSRI